MDFAAKVTAAESFGTFSWKATLLSLPPTLTIFNRPSHRLPAFNNQRSRVSAANHVLLCPIPLWAEFILEYVPQPWRWRDRSAQKVNSTAPRRFWTLRLNVESITISTARGLPPSFFSTALQRWQSARSIARQNWSRKTRKKSRENGFGLKNDAA